MGNLLETDELYGLNHGELELFSHIEKNLIFFYTLNGIVVKYWAIIFNILGSIPGPNNYYLISILSKL